jgi:hypothetical protein
MDFREPSDYNFYADVSSRKYMDKADFSSRKYMDKADRRTMKHTCMERKQTDSLIPVDSTREY